MADQQNRVVSDTLAAIGPDPVVAPLEARSAALLLDSSEGEGRRNMCLDDASLATLLAGNISPRDRAAVLAHLEQCSECQDLTVIALQALGSGSMGASAVHAVNFKPGSIVGERYRIDHFIARGGMGEVYQAYDRELGERVALKTVLSTASDNVHAQQHLKAEVQLARRISHPNICRIYDLGRHVLGAGDECVHFLSMEFIEGESLGQRLRRAPVSADEARCIAHQLLLGLSAAHAAGVLHRDFKSDNVMLRAGAAENIKAVITDFGLARALDTGEALRQSDGHRLVGSVAYMAPEQVVGDRLGPPADIYAFGVVFFEMLTRHLPFVGDSPLAVALKRLTEAPPPPSKVRPELGTGWDEFVLRCLRRDPGQRYASVSAALTDFERLAARSPPSVLSRKAAWSFAVLGLAVLVVLGAVAVPAIPRARRLETQRSASSPAPAPLAPAPPRGAEKPPLLPASPPDPGSSVAPAPTPAQRPSSATTGARRSLAGSRRGAATGGSKAGANDELAPSPIRTQQPSAPNVPSSEHPLKLDREDPWEKP